MEFGSKIVISRFSLRFEIHANNMLIPPNHTSHCNKVANMTLYGGIRQNSNDIFLEGIEYLRPSP